MKLLISACLLCSALSMNAQENEPRAERIAEPMGPRKIQVLLEKESAGALLEVKGPYYLFNPHDGSRIASGLLGKRFMIHEMENGLKWGEEFPGIHQLYIKPRSNETTIFVNGIQYSGAVAIYGIAGTVNIVNELDVEDYVKSVLTTQFSASLEPEVMSALAIIARTDAYYHATKGSDSFWHIAAEEARFQGSGLVVHNSVIDRVVDSTRHLILVHPENGKNLPFAAQWTENCAGKTAPYLSIFRKDGFAPQKGVEAPHAALARKESKWTYQVGKKSLAYLLDVPRIQSIELFQDKNSNKVYAVRVKDGAETYDIDFLELQHRIGSKNVQSSDFTITVKDDVVLFDGFGKGHGVGLCLYSASALAQNGENAVKILSKFFPETYLYNLNALPE